MNTQIINHFEVKWTRKIAKMSFGKTAFIGREQVRANRDQLFSLDERRRQLAVAFDDDRLVHDLLASAQVVLRRRHRRHPRRRCSTSLQQAVLLFQRLQLWRQISDLPTMTFNVVARTLQVDLDGLEPTERFLVNATEFFQLRLSAEKIAKTLHKHQHQTWAKFCKMSPKIWWQNFTEMHFAKWK